MEVLTAFPTSSIFQKMYACFIFPNSTDLINRGKDAFLICTVYIYTAEEQYDYLSGSELTKQTRGCHITVSKQLRTMNYLFYTASLASEFLVKTKDQSISSYDKRQTSTYYLGELRFLSFYNSHVYRSVCYLHLRTHSSYMDPL